MEAATFTSPRLSAAQFTRVAELLRRLTGIVMRTGKEELAQSRLTKRLRATKLSTFDEYLALVERDETERALMVDVLTTNKTNFLREPAHFELLAELASTCWAGLPELRIWSAACSTGEEPYTIAITLLERAPLLAQKTRILATDLASHVLATGRAGRYRKEALEGTPAQFRERYFHKRSDGCFEVVPAVRSMVSFARLNLLDRWPMRGPFHAIFCRNVMIYFDKDTQLSLANRFHPLLADDGYLLIGHAESLGTTGHGLRYVRPAVYRA